MLEEKYFNNRVAIGNNNSVDILAIGEVSGWVMGDIICSLFGKMIVRK